MSCTIHEQSDYLHSNSDLKRKHVLRVVHRKEYTSAVISKHHVLFYPEILCNRSFKNTLEVSQRRIIDLPNSFDLLDLKSINPKVSSSTTIFFNSTEKNSKKPEWGCEAHPELWPPETNSGSKSLIVWEAPLTTLTHSNHRTVGRATLLLLWLVVSLTENG